MAKFTYWLNFNKASPSWSEFWPNKEAEAVKKRPTGMEFYREEIGELQINRRRGNKDNSTIYDTLETWFTDATKFNDEIEIEIYRGTRSGTLYYAGYFSVIDASLDKEKKTFKITPIIDDNYRSFLDIKDAQFDMLNTTITEDVIVGDPKTIAAWQVGSPNASIPQDFNTFTVGANAGILTSVIDSDGANKEARNSSVGALVNGDIVYIDISAYTQTGAQHPYIDVVNGLDASLVTGGGVQITTTGILALKINATDSGYLLLYTNTAADTTNFSMTFTLEISSGIESSVGRLYMDFIELFIVNGLFMGLAAYAGKVKSTFLNNDALPSDAPSSIVSFMTTNPNGNYASGNTSANPLNKFIISETKYWVDGNVTENKVSFLDLMSDMKEILDAGWYIDDDGDFRIEHIKYFEKLVDDSTALNLTSAPYDKYKAETDAKELISNKSLLANREQFAWEQAGTVTDSQDFVGVDIIYNNLETISNVLKHEARNVTTDIVYLINNASSAGAGGFVYLQCWLNGDGDYVVQSEAGVLSGGYIKNGHFSWANLQDKYWTWRRMSENGDMNNGATVAFDSAVKFLEQANIKFGYQSTLSGFVKITTSQGTGQQIETKRDLDTDFLTILLAFNPYV